MKRARTGDQLTGGSGDVSPQILVNPVVMAAANTYFNDQIGLPQIRLPTRKGKSLVLEMLGVHVIHPPLDTAPAAGGTSAQSQFQLATSAIAAIDFTNAKVQVGQSILWRGAFSAGGSFEQSQQLDQFYDTTDGAGHGILIATDNLFMGVNTIGFTAAATFTMRLLYRFKEVGLDEYIGIVQSQQ
jgi:hypothetical protein